MTDTTAGYDVAYYQTINAEEAEQAARLAGVLIWKYQPKSALDIGCATGLYLKPFLDASIDGYGIDNAEATIDAAVMMVPKGRIKIADITKASIGHRADLAMCLEVLEHIPESGAAAAVKHIAESSDVIIFSAAQPGQGGHGHINCQPKEYWQDLFTARGYVRRLEDEDYIRTIMAAGYHMGWLTNNLMIFGRAKS